MPQYTYGHQKACTLCTAFFGDGSSVPTCRKPALQEPKKLVKIDLSDPN